MTVTVRDARTQPGDRKWIETVYRDYMDDLGLLNTGIFPSLGEIGHREPDQLERWFMDSTATLLTIVDDGQPAGFALVARDTRASREVLGAKIRTRLLQSDRTYGASCNHRWH